MIAVDTNVLIRLLTDDDPKQATVARGLFARGPIWISKTVLLEAGWVLRSLYKFDENNIRIAFVKLAGLKNVHIEDEAAVAAALAMVADGLELADALHLASKPPEASFVSFDKAFVQSAKRGGVTVISAL